MVNRASWINKVFAELTDHVVERAVSRGFRGRSCRPLGGRLH
jgi:hypothetical protein